MTSTTTNDTSGDAAEARQRPGGREVVQRDADLGPTRTRRAASARAAPSSTTHAAAVIHGERDPAPAERADDRTGAGPVRGLRGDERDDRDGTEVHRPPEQDAEERDAGDEAVQRRARRTAPLPGPQQRDEGDECERSPVERREARASSESRADRGRGAREERFRAVRRGAHSQSRQRSFSPRASWLSGFTRKHERQRNSSRLAGDDPRRDVALLVGLEVLVLEVVGFLFEPIGLRALVEQHVERLLDVVGVQLLFEVDDVVVFLFGGFLDRCDGAGYRYCDSIQGVLFYEQLDRRPRRRPRRPRRASRSSSSRSTSSSRSGSSSSKSSSSAITGLPGVRGAISGG